MSITPVRLYDKRGSIIEVSYECEKKETDFQNVIDTSLIKPSESGIQPYSNKMPVAQASNLNKRLNTGASFHCVRLKSVKGFDAQTGNATGTHMPWGDHRCRYKSSESRSISLLQPSTLRVYHILIRFEFLFSLEPVFKSPAVLILTLTLSSAACPT